jgi:mono/diheme cytochrome c family protein
MMNRRFVVWIGVSVGCLLPVSPLLAADIESGKSLHDQHCTACHASITGGKPNAIYTRPDRRVTSKEELQAQVARCERSLELQWRDPQIKEVSAYLNEAFYKFE